MNNSSLSALARAVSSVGRQYRPRAFLFPQLRSFSSTVPTMGATENRQRTLRAEKESLGGPPAETGTTESVLSEFTKTMSGGKNSVTPDYQKFSEQMKEFMPYSDAAPSHHLHVYAHKHNTLLTLTKPNGNPMISISCGQLGFRKGGREGYDPAYQLTAHLFAQIQERGLLPEIQRLDITFRDFGIGREAFTKVLLGVEGRHIRGLVSRVSDSTRIKFGGTRSPRVRRL
ncbi:translational machinery component [Aspergillus californicus]